MKLSEDCPGIVMDAAGFCAVQVLVMALTSDEACASRSNMLMPLEPALLLLQGEGGQRQSDISSSHERLHGLPVLCSRRYVVVLATVTTIK